MQTFAYLCTIKQQQRSTTLNLNNMTTNQQVAATILNQLGGIFKLNAMLGLKDVFAVENGVSFKIKVKAAANYIKITLVNDLYNLEIGQIKGMNYKIVNQVTGVYAEDLKKIIEKTCKVQLSL